MTAAILVLSGLWLIYLLIEAHRAKRARAKIKHVVHVNGTRGKSSVSRLIEAGLRGGGLRVFCKTTGTDPMTIDVDGRQALLRRRGKANIKEQISILRQAASQDAQILVVECMAVQPELQRAAQHDILKANIGVITNVRRDHTDVMGETLSDIASALSNTVPKNGVLFTAERKHTQELSQRAQALGTIFQSVVPDGSEPPFDFAENIALALAVCRYLGVERETALRGMEKHYHRDPYALSLHRWGEILLIGGFSINDVQSTCFVWEKMAKKHGLDDQKRILLINNRPDRGSRTEDMVRVCSALRPEEVWLMGASRGYMRRKLRRVVPNCVVKVVPKAENISPEMLSQRAAVFAIGNIAGPARSVMERVRKEGEELVP